MRKPLYQFTRRYAEDYSYGLSRVPTMLWITSLFFLPCAIKAFCNRRVQALCLFSTLTTTSLIHHSSCLPWSWITNVDKVLAHFAGLWGIMHGIHVRAWKMLPLGLWSPVAFYHIEPRVPLHLADWIHATIHITSSIAFYNLLWWKSFMDWV